MIGRARTKGFTIVELLIVIVVIVILAIITGLMYTNAQKQANDVKIKDAAYKVAEATQLFLQQNYKPGPSSPKLTGNWGSTVAIGADGKCPDGNGIGYIGKSAYACTLEEMLVANNYLPADFLSGVVNKNTMMFYWGNGAKAGTHGMIYWTLSDPTTEDTAHYEAEAKKCGHTAGLSDSNIVNRTNWGMRDAFCFRVW